MMKKLIILMSLSVSFLFAGLYDYKYNVNSKANVSSPALSNLLMYGDFEKIIRFDALIFDKNTNKLDNKSKEELDKIVQTIKDYGDKKIIVTMIGYTKHVETHNEKIVRESSFSYKDIFPDVITKDQSSDESLSYAQAIEKYLLDNDIKKDILVVENRRGDEKAFTEGTELGKDLNHRVMVTIYEPVKKIFKKAKKPVKQVQPEVKIVDLQINYANDSAIIPDDQKYKVEAFAAFLNSFDQYNATIEGHTSSVGSAKYNKDLSQRRAQGVVDMLISLGIDANRLEAVGKGESEPIATNKTKEGRLQNRRTIAKLYTK
jgi:outer membrane protein OmpA-like peptidoglycan-associated protein